jgi:hypothetical protein
MRLWFKQPGRYTDERWPGAVSPGVARALGGSVFRYRHAGPLAEFWYIRAIGDGRHFRFRLGWKLGQIDVPGSEALGYALQLMPYRKG